MRATVYTDMLAAGLVIGNHESDLYVSDTAEARAILERHGNTTASAFRDERDGGRALDVPFAFDPWWEARLAAAPAGGGR